VQSYIIFRNEKIEIKDIYFFIIILYFINLTVKNKILIILQKFNSLYDKQQKRKN